MFSPLIWFSVQNTYWNVLKHWCRGRGVLISRILSTIIILTRIVASSVCFIQRISLYNVGHDLDRLSNEFFIFIFIILDGKISWFSTRATQQFISLIVINGIKFNGGDFHFLIDLIKLLNFFIRTKRYWVIIDKIQENQLCFLKYTTSYFVNYGINIKFTLLGFYPLDFLVITCF